MGTLSVDDASLKLHDLVSAAGATGERVVLSLGGRPAAAIVGVRDLGGLEETVELLSSGDVVRRLAEGDAAFDAGDVLAGPSLCTIDPSGRYAKARPDVKPGEVPWELLVGGQASRTISKLPAHISDLVVRFIFERLTSAPQLAGVELRGRLSRRFAARVETETIIYRLDTVKHSVRVLDVLHRGGLIGQGQSAGQRW
jgi:prevent-host-death family protein